MNFSDKLLWQAYGIPSGILGKLGGKIMSCGRKREIVKHVLELLEVQQDDIVLEIGFGPGIGIQCINESIENGYIVGIDPSEVMIEIANKRNANAIKNGKVKLLKGRAAQLPFPDEFFTKAYAMNSMQLWPNKMSGLQEVLRTLKIGGRLVLSFDGPARSDSTRETVHANLKEACFKEINTRNSESTVYVSARKK